MKKLLLVLFVAVLIGCNKERPEGESVLSYEEYSMVVASKKVQGVVGISTHMVADVFAIKMEGQDIWSSFDGFIKGFDYEAGYEYVLEVSETVFLDYRRGDPAWSEYNLIKIISKTKKESENMPQNLIPEWYSE